MAKGRDFEREISKDMSLWLTNGENPDCIWYTKSSGGRATRRVKTNQESKRYDHGDLGPDDACVYYYFDTFNCELKTGYGKKHKKQTTLWSVTDIIDSSQSTPIFYDFWWQSINDALESEREPMLIFRRNRRTACIGMRPHIFNAFTKHKTINFDSITVNFADTTPTITLCNIKHFFDHTWGIVNEGFVKLKINRAILLYERGKL
jgi:hypothetical protein